MHICFLGLKAYSGCMAWPISLIHASYGRIFSCFVERRVVLHPENLKTKVEMGGRKTILRKRGKKWCHYHSAHDYNSSYFNYSYIDRHFQRR